MDATESHGRAAEELRRECEELRARNRELMEAIDAIRLGEVDAIVVAEGDRPQVYALEGADHPYRVLVERIQEGALTLTTEGMILYANAAFGKMRRLPLPAIFGTPLRGHFAPRDRARFDALLEASREEGRRGEMSICNGTATIPVHISMTPVTMNAETKISVVVTDRRQDFGRLRLQSRMLDSVVDAVTAANPGGTIIYWNEAAARLYGWEASEAIGRALTDTVDGGMPEEDALRVREVLAAGGTWSGEYVARHRDGHGVPVLATRAPVYDEDGVPVGVIGTSHDISEQKAAEAELARYAGELQRSNEDLKRFAYVASHDLQEPLRSIVSFSQLLERRYKGQLDQDADDYIAFIVEGGTRMQTLIRDLLQLSRIETGAKPLEPTDAAVVVADVVRSMETPLREAGATVEVDEMPVVMADAAQLEQVLTNLIGNAVKYRRSGVPPRIRISARREGRLWEFAVADNGIGIEEQYFGQIFEMFRRLHTHDEYEGTGIGLAVVRRIIERHGGTIWVESTPGEGSAFHFTLIAA